MGQRPKPWLIAAVVAWMLCVCALMGVVVRYEVTPGEAMRAPRRWPSELEAAGIHRTPGRPAVIVLAHPRCPCTVSTLAVLAELRERADKVGGRADIFVIFTMPADLGPTPSSWTQTEGWSRAREIAGAKVIADPSGALAALLGARTSGQVVAFDDHGDLAFAGGITPSRGHGGPCAGADALEALLSGRQLAGSPAARETPVFGCALIVHGKAGLLSCAPVCNGGQGPEATPCP